MAAYHTQRKVLDHEAIQLQVLTKYVLGQIMDFIQYSKKFKLANPNKIVNRLETYPWEISD